MKKLKFNELNLSERIQKAVVDMGFEEASPIQAETIPILLAGKDLIGQAQTGTGKTAAFAIPIIDKIDFETKELQALVLCPTRELVIQVTEEFRRLTKYFFNLAIVPVYGGQEIERQITALSKKPQVVIGTPGRLMDHMRRGTVKLDKIKFVVLDEADEMLDMGFREDMEVILKDTSPQRQTIMFSATMPDDIVELTRQFQNNPSRIDVTCHKINAPKIEQFYYELLEKSKPEALARLIDFYGIKLALVFCNTKMQVDNLVEILKTRGYLAEALHGDLNQRQRDKVMNGFRNGIVEVLVATDVAGRGIDVNDIEAVFNYDLPRDDEDYIHRIGRTARAGKTGKAFTFIVGRQIYNLKRIERTNGIKVTCHQIPSISDLDETRLRYFADKIKDTLHKGGLSKYVNLVENLMGDEYTTLDIAAALLKLSMGDKIEANEEIEEIKHKYRYDKEKEYQKNFSGGNREDKYVKRTYKDGESGENRGYGGARDGRSGFSGKTKDYGRNKEFGKKRFEGKAKSYAPRTGDSGDAQPSSIQADSGSGGGRQFKGKDFKGNDYKSRDSKNKEFKDKNFKGKEFKDNDFKNKESRGADFKDKEVKDGGYKGKTKSYGQGSGGSGSGSGPAKSYGTGKGGGYKGKESGGKPGDKSGAKKGSYYDRFKKN